MKRKIWMRICLWWHCLTHLHREYFTTQESPVWGEAFGCFDCKRVFWSSLESNPESKINKGDTK